jgi:hypothetical protein
MLPLMDKILHLYILVDRSFSMQAHWNETINTLNSYMLGLRKEQVALRINLAFFDKENAGYAFNNIFTGTSLHVPQSNILQHRYVKATEWVPLSDSDVSISPRGSTPLYDSIVEFGSLPKTHGLKKVDLVQFIILTDGDENTSMKYGLDDAKKLLTKFAKKNWPVVYLGANIEAFKGGAKIVSSTKTLNNYNPHKWNETAVAMASSSMRYYSTNDSVQANFLDTERKNIS